jgi:hypothetical protein
MFLKTALPICAAFLCLSAAAARSADFAATMFGHEVAITSGDDGEKLTVDGKQVYADRFLSIERVDVVGGLPVLVVVSSNGGNACPGSPFVVSFPQGSQPRVDDAIDDCRGAASIVIEGDHLLFATLAVPGQPSRRWTWTPGQGFAEAGDVAFQPDAAKGWDDMKGAQHPADLLSIGPIADVANAMLAEHRQEFEKSITGPGSGEYKNGFYIGEACQPHMCTEAEALIAADISARKLYLAWKPAGKKIILRPAIRRWPAPALAALKEWSAKWP